MRTHPFVRPLGPVRCVPFNPWDKPAKQASSCQDVPGGGIMADEKDDKAKEAHLAEVKAKGEAFPDFVPW